MTTKYWKSYHRGKEAAIEFLRTCILPDAPKENDPDIFYGWFEGFGVIVKKSILSDGKELYDFLKKYKANRPN